MTGPAIPSDAELLLARLASVAAAVDGPPDLAYELGRQAFALRRLDDELAELVAAELAGVRGPDDDPAVARIGMVSFAADGLDIDLQIQRAQGLTVLGRLDGPTAAGIVEVVVESADGTQRAVEVDPYGRFVVTDAPTTLLRLRLSTARGGVTTAWVRL